MILDAKYDELFEVVQKAANTAERGGIECEVALFNHPLAACSLVMLNVSVPEHLAERMRDALAQAVDSVLEAGSIQGATKWRTP